MGFTLITLLVQILMGANYRARNKKNNTICEFNKVIYTHLHSSEYRYNIDHIITSSEENIGKRSKQ